MEGSSYSGSKRKEVPHVEDSDSSDSSSTSNYYAPKRCKIESSGDDGEAKSCHQCKRNNKGRVVNCSMCEKKRYCARCISNNYPKMNEEDFVEACPFCRDICNCKNCLRLELPIKNQTRLSEDDKFHYSKYLLKRLLPFVRQFNEQQIMEREMEAKIRGLSISDVKVPIAYCPIDERMNCDYCRTSIADYHRSCTRCSHTYCLPVKEVFDPIHDGAFYLNSEHKKRLKKEYGIEPWTVVQNLGDALFIPAGCPFQVRNLKSCIQVSTGFVSPENVDACLRLTEEIRVLPQEHGAKEDKLGVKKLMLYAMRSVLDNLDAFTKKRSDFQEEANVSQVSHVLTKKVQPLSSIDSPGSCSQMLRIEPISCEQTEYMDISSDSSKESGHLGSWFDLESDYNPATQNKVTSKRRLLYLRRFLTPLPK
ncbi:hypothetical protein POM88_006344 [Heracleum sosnowskyi]|uniref:JmjC domain-containing protein n=1 Tax=Heracleum sosnowskyi TaxID=360622 RepID=A0AAD8N5B4_9APIA|nr:hypothetical protein POM88_006344 [Heracleum sosnowskyi]